MVTSKKKKNDRKDRVRSMFFDVVSSFRFRVCFVSFVLVVDVEGRFSCFRPSADPFFSFFFPLMLLRGQSTAHCPFFFFFFFFFQEKKKKKKKTAHLEPEAFSEADGALACRTRTAARSEKEREREGKPKKMGPPSRSSLVSASKQKKHGSSCVERRGGRRQGRFSTFPSRFDGSFSW